MIEVKLLLPFPPLLFVFLAVVVVRDFSAASYGKPNSTNKESNCHTEQGSRVSMGPSHEETRMLVLFLHYSLGSSLFFALFLFSDWLPHCINMVSSNSQGNMLP